MAVVGIQDDTATHLTSASDSMRGNTSTYLAFTPDPNDMKILLNDGWMDGLCLDDNCPRATLPKEPGFYMATLEFWYEAGYFEGYPAPGESSVEIILKNVRKLDVKDPFN